MISAPSVFALRRDVLGRDRQSGLSPSDLLLRIRARCPQTLAGSSEANCAHRASQQLGRQSPPWKRPK
jgi:hypothetical protein